MIIIVVAVLYFMKEIFVTLALAMLFSFLLNPLVRRFERWRLPRSRIAASRLPGWQEP